MKKLTTTSVLCSAIALASSANAQVTADSFGTKGTIAIHALTGAPLLAGSVLGVELGATPILGLHTTTNGEPDTKVGNVTTEHSTRSTAFYINPRVHYFVIDHLSIGAEVLLASFSSTNITKTNGTTKEDDVPAPTALGVMPIIGYDIPISAKFSIWPQAGLGVRHGWYTESVGNQDVDHSETWWFVAADVPIMFHLVPNLSIGVGPGVTVTLSKSQSAKAGGTSVSQDVSTTQIRWLSASLVGSF